MYRPYRGRRANRRRVLRIVLITLLSIFIVGCLFFLLFFNRHPLWKEYVEKRTQELAQQEAQSQQVEEKPVAEQTPPPAPEVPTYTDRTIEIPLAKLSDTAWLGGIDALQAQTHLTALAVVVKDAEGNVADIESLQPTLQKLKEKNLKLTAVAYAFADNLYAKQNKKASLLNTKGKSWRLPDGKRWLDPASPESTSYLQSIAERCGVAGFDEIQWRSFGYPPEGATGRIAYPADLSTVDSRAILLASKLQEMQTAVQQVKMSVAVPAHTAEVVQNETTSENVQKFATVAHRIYVQMAVQSETAGDSLRAILQPKLGSETDKIIPWYTDTVLYNGLYGTTQSFYIVEAS